MSDTYKYYPLPGITTWTLLITPPMITALLTTSRYLQTRYPLRRLKLRYIIVFLFLYLVYVVVCLSCLFFQPNTRYYSRIQAVWNVFPGLDMLGTVLAFTGPCIVCQVLSVLFSLFTVWELLRSIRDPAAVQLRKHGWKCSLKILISNFGSILFMAFYLAMIRIAGVQEERSKTDCILYLMYSVAVPVFLSVFNPVIFVLFTPQTFIMAWEKLAHRQSIPSRVQSIDLLNIHPKPHTAIEAKTDTPKVYKIGKTSTVCQVKQISEVDLHNMVYSNFHTIRKETENNALERMQSPVVFDLSEGGDRQRRVSRFRSMDQSESLISPVSGADDNFSVFSRNSSVNVGRRDTAASRGGTSRKDSEGVLDTRSFPNVAVLNKKALSAIAVVAERESESKSETNSNKETETKPGALTLDKTKIKSESVSVEAISLDAKVSASSGEITEDEVIADIIAAVEPQRSFETLKREDILSNSDNMSDGDLNEFDWEIEKEAVLTALRSKITNTIDKR